MESQPQNPEFRNNPENFHPIFASQGYQVHFVPYAYILLSDKSPVYLGT